MQAKGDWMQKEQVKVFHQWLSRVYGTKVGLADEEEDDDDELVPVKHIENLLVLFQTKDDNLLLLASSLLLNISTTIPSVLANAAFSRSDLCSRLLQVFRPEYPIRMFTLMIIH